MRLQNRLPTLKTYMYKFGALGSDFLNALYILWGGGDGGGILAVIYKCCKRRLPFLGKEHGDYCSWSRPDSAASGTLPDGLPTAQRQGVSHLTPRG